MSSKFEYKSDDFDRQAQRFVVPLYYKDELGNFVFSSTGTLLRYNGNYYIVFACHALEEDNNLEGFYLIDADFGRRSLTSISIGYFVYKDDDIVIVDCFNMALSEKNYFNLNENSFLGIDKKHFSWTGFPSSKCKTPTISKTKSPEILKSSYIHTDDSGSYFKNAQYFTIHSKVIMNNNKYISGFYNNKNITLKYKGKISDGPSPKGMSGGAMYFSPRNMKLKENLDETFREPLY